MDCRTVAGTVYSYSYCRTSYRIINKKKKADHLNLESLQSEGRGSLSTMCST